MKKALLVCMLLISIVLSLAACGGKDNPPSNVGGNAEDGGNTEDGGDGDLLPDENTVGAAVYNSFAAAIETNKNATAFEIAKILEQNSDLPLALSIVEISNETEHLEGFGEYRVTGFKSAAMLTSMMRTTQFIAYVFELDENTDADAFVKAQVTRQKI